MACPGCSYGSGTSLKASYLPGTGDSFPAASYSHNESYSAGHHDYQSAPQPGYSSLPSQLDYQISKFLREDSGQENALREPAEIAAASGVVELPARISEVLPEQARGRALLQEQPRPGTSITRVEEETLLVRRKRIFQRIIPAEEPGRTIDIERADC